MKVDTMTPSECQGWGAGDGSRGAGRDIAEEPSRC